MNPHQGMPVITSGLALEQSKHAALLIHGRNQVPEDMLTLSKQLEISSISYVIPAAKNKSWYPNKFMEDTETNEPYLSHALDVIDKQLADLESRNISAEQQILIGFSQGACLVSEYLCRYDSRPKYVFILTGGFQGAEISRQELYEKQVKTLKGTEVYLSNGDEDPWVPLSRTVETAHLFAKHGASVTMKVFPEREHEISINEVNDIRMIINSLVKPDK